MKAVRVSYLVVIITVMSTLAVPAGTTQSVISFANPSSNGANPLISVDLAGNSITGGWNDTLEGLNLVAHFLGGRTYANAWFTVTPLVYPSNSYYGRTDTGGTIQFYEDAAPADQPLMAIDFGYVNLTPGNLFADEVFTLGEVNISGPLTEGFNFSQETVSLSLANQTFIGGDPLKGMTATCSFDSSAMIVPEPISLGLMALGGAFLVARRKRQA